MFAMDFEKNLNNKNLNHETAFYFQPPVIIMISIMPIIALAQTDTSRCKKRLVALFKITILSTVKDSSLIQLQ